jgi:hypothetical protein
MRVSLLWLEINAQPTYVLIDRVLMAPVFSVGISSKCRLPMVPYSGDIKRAWDNGIPSSYTTDAQQASSKPH